MASTRDRSTASGLPTISLSVPVLGERELGYLRDALDSGWVSSAGPWVARFENEVAGRVGAPHAVATINGTAALHVALIVAGVGAEDEVLLPSLTFIAPANAVRYVGAHPVFLDVEPDHGQLDDAAVEDYLQTRCVRRGDGWMSRETRRRVGAILAVHLLGHPCDMDRIMAVGRRYGLPVIEDASAALGSTCRGRPAGSLGDVGVFSFNGNKIVTAGGGGMLVTDREEWARSARYLTTQASDDPVERVHGSVGFNYRLPALLAAFGCAQVETLPERIEARRRIARAYDQALAGIAGVGIMTEARWAGWNRWLYTILVEDSPVGSRELMRRLADLGIETRPLWQPMHRSPAHRTERPEVCPNADRLYQTALSLPSTHNLGAEEVNRVVEGLRASLRQPLQAPRGDP